MNETTIASVIEAKQAHASAVLDKIDEAIALIHTQPELWFGGLPPALLQFESMFKFHAAQLRQTFELAAPPST